MVNKAPKVGGRGGGKSSGQEWRDGPRKVGPLLRRARNHLGLSLREVERRIGRSNAYLSQVERGLIQQPDPAALLDLAELYGLNFMTLAEWAGWTESEGTEAQGGRTDQASHLVRRVLDLDNEQRAKVLAFIERLAREART